MGCCRGRKRPKLDNQAMSTQCREIERLGSNVRLYPIRTSKGSTLFVLRLENGQRVEVESYLRAHGCGGSVSSNLLRRMGSLTTLAQSRPDLFLRYANTGISLSNLMRL